ncbi:MAG: phosphate ABC transporter permease subunit PstC [Planctomycetia bacterium]|nr:phosphate ABC transporter permease subunit PstC [Planctomycetia bacterium]
MNDRFFRLLCGLASLVIPLLLVLLVARLTFDSLPAWNAFGLSFLWTSDWNPVLDRYGAAGAVCGTLITTAIAVVVAVPIALLTACLLVGAPKWLERPLSEAIDLLAAIPSVIYGIWGLYVLAPVMQSFVIPFLRETLGLAHLPFCDVGSGGFGIFTAGLVLAIMILPYISSVARDVFYLTPPLLREAAFGIGCTRYETLRFIILRHGFRGLLGGVFIGLGRALGETMAVLFVIGNIAKIPDSLFGSGTSIASTLAVNFAESDGLLRATLFALAFVLFALAATVQLFAWYCMKPNRS